MRPITYDPRAMALRSRFDARAWVPVAPRPALLRTVARYAFALYVAQAAGGALVGFAVPFLRLWGVL